MEVKAKVSGASIVTRYDPEPRLIGFLAVRSYLACYPLRSVHSRFDFQSRQVYEFEKRSPLDSVKSNASSVEK